MGKTSSMALLAVNWSKPGKIPEMPAFTVVAPGFPRGATTDEFVARTYHLARFSVKLHENERNLTERDPPPVDPPMIYYRPQTQFAAR